MSWTGKENGRERRGGKGRRKSDERDGRRNVGAI